MKTATNKKVAIVLTTFLFLTQPVFGQTLFGSFDCGQWVSGKAETRKAWILGFMSGMSMATDYFGIPAAKKANGDWLDKVNSADQIFLFVDNYCQKNPLRKVESAGHALYLELNYK